MTLFSPPWLVLCIHWGLSTNSWTSSHVMQKRIKGSPDRTAQVSRRPQGITVFSLCVSELGSVPSPIVRKLNVLAPHPTVSTRDLTHIAANNFQCDSSEKNNRSRKQGLGVFGSVFVLLCDKLGTPGSWDRFESWLSHWVVVMALGELLNFSGPKFPQVSTGLDFRMPFSNIVLPFCGTGIAHGCPKDPLIAPGNRWLHWDPFGWWFQGSDLQGKWLRKAVGGNRKDLGLTGTQPITCLPVPFCTPHAESSQCSSVNALVLLSRWESVLLFSFPRI